MPGAGSLSSVVSGLVRAQMGASVPSSVSDGDLDKHVADLIVKEAKQKAERYAAQGIRAYLPSSEPAATRRPDKRFLTHILRRTDDHNRSVLKAQADAAAVAKAERDEEERRERRARAEEAAEAERMRRRGARDGERERRKRRRDRDRSWERAWDSHDDDDGWGGDRDRDRDGERRRRAAEKRPARAAEDDDRERRHRRSHKRSRRSSRERDEEERDHRGEPSERKRRSPRHRSRSRTPGSSAGKSPRTREVEPVKQSSRKGGERPEGEPETSRSRHRQHGSRLQSPSPDEEATLLSDTGENTDSHWRPSRSPREQPRPRFDSPSPGPSLPPPPPEERSSSPARSPEPRPKSRKKGKRRRSSSRPRSPSYSPPPEPPFPPSKMDKYFEASYDPRLDVAPLAAPTIPATGLLDDADFAGWDAMLELIKQRRQDKEERRWLEKHGFSADESSKSKKAALAGFEEPGVMDIQYKKRGSVREWDMGKDGVD